jgi:hypothetical protein
MTLMLVVGQCKAESSRIGISRSMVLTSAAVVEASMAISQHLIVT